jgi:DNA repair protein RadD
MDLRPYQLEAVDSALNALDAGGNPALQLATGTGKSLIIAELARRRLPGRTWVLTHVQQLVRQNAATYARHTGAEPGVVCTGLKRRDYDAPIIYGTIQTVISATGRMPPPALIIIDEAHRVPHNHGEPTQYERLLSGQPQAQRIAMTATPWRMDNGVIYGEGEQFWFDRLAYAYNVPRAVQEGYLCPLVGVETAVQLDVGGVKIDSDYVQSEVANLETEEWLISVARSLGELAVRRRHVAVYCPTVVAAKRAALVIQAMTGWTTEVLTSALDEEQRQAVLGRFTSGQTRVLCSVDMLTTGFDHPALDCIVCLRPTLSSSLWVQMQGRGTRLHESKRNCLILDYVGNLIRLGGVDMMETYYREKNDAGHLEQVRADPAERREREMRPGLIKLSPIDPMTGQEAQDGAVLTAQVHTVNSVAITTRRDPATPILLVNYNCMTPEGARLQASQFINSAQPDQRAVRFFNQRALAVRLPAPARSVLWQLRNAPRQPQEVRIIKRGRYWNVLEERFGGQ